MRFSEQKFKTVDIIGSLIILILGKTLRIKIQGQETFPTIYNRLTLTRGRRFYD